jgi:hypothetical protein
VALDMVAFIEVLFWFSSLYILPFWLMMWFAPTHERTVDIFIILGSDMPTPDIVVEMFSEREVILIGWLHYLAFDLFVGRWTWQRLVASGQPIYVSMPVLLLSMMVAPLGALLGLIVTRNHSDLNSETIAQEA